MVCRCATRKAGKARIVAASALAWAAVAENAVLELSTSCWSAAGERAIEENTWPPSRSSVLVAALSRFSTASTESTLVANGYSSARAAFRSCPRPVSAIPCCCIQVWKAWRVVGSKVERIWSSCTVGATWPWGSAAPSASFGPLCEPGESST